MRIFSILIICSSLLVAFSKAAEAEKEEEVTGESSEESEAEEELSEDGAKIDLKCNQGLLNSYGIDGRVHASREEMVLCNEVKYSCCSPLDELKYHKNWFAYYEPKLRVTHDRMAARLKRLSEHLMFFKELNFDDFETLVVNGDHDLAKELIVLIKKVELDPELKPILDEFKLVREFDEQVKKGAFCMICNYENHEYFGFTGGTLLMKEKYCMQIVDKFLMMIKMFHKMLHPLILIIHKFISHFAVNYYDRKEWHLVRKVRENMDVVDRCFPEDNSNFDLETCRDLCNKYNFMEMPETYFGEFEFYEYFMTRSDRFREWLELAKESPGKYVRQPLVLESPEEQEGAQEDGAEEAKEADGVEIVDDPENDELPGEERALTEFGRFELEKRKRRHQFIREKKKLRKRKLKERILSRSDMIEEFRIREKMDEVESNLKGYKSMVKKMKKKNTHLLKTIYKKSQKMFKSKSQKTKRNLINRRQVRESLNREEDFFGDANINRKRPKRRFSSKGHSFKQKGTTPNTLHMKMFRSKNHRSLNNEDQQEAPEEPAEEQKQEDKEEEEGDDEEDEGEPAEQAPAPAPQAQPAATPKEPEDPAKFENVNCKDCDKTRGSHNSTDVYKSDFIMRSKQIKFSKYLNDSSACTTCSFGNNVHNSTNIAHSNNTFNSSNVNFSNEIHNSTLVINSTHVHNSTNVTHSNNVTNSVNITISEECQDCVNCQNCVQCRNVTNCVNCRNVTNSANLTNVRNADLIFNSTDISNAYNLTNATNMTNASNCVGCENNYDCDGIRCMIHRVAADLQAVLDEKVAANTAKIIKRIYDLTRVGDVQTYKNNEDLFDRHIFRANNYLFDIARYKVIFDADGFDFDYQVSAAFDSYSTGVFQAAYGHFTKSKFDFESTGIYEGTLTEDEGYPRVVVDLINENADFNSVHDFMSDAEKGVISFDSLREKDDAELMAYDHYLHRISREHDLEITCKASAPDFKECEAIKEEVKRAEQEMEKAKKNGEEGNEEANEEGEAAEPKDEADQNENE